MGSTSYLAFSLDPATPATVLQAAENPATRSAASGYSIGRSFAAPEVTPLSIHSVRLEPLHLILEGEPRLVPPGTEVHTLLPPPAADLLARPLAALYNHRVGNFHAGFGPLAGVSTADLPGARRAAR